MVFIILDFQSKDESSILSTCSKKRKEKFGIFEFLSYIYNKQKQQKMKHCQSYQFSLKASWMNRPEVKDIRLKGLTM